MDSVNDSQEVITLTFWERKEDMDRYHTLSNELFAKITEKIKPLFEQLPERNDYTLFTFKLV